MDVQQCCPCPTIERVIHQTVGHRREVVYSESRDDCTSCGHVRWLHADKVDERFRARHEDQMKIMVAAIEAKGEEDDQ